MSHTSEKNHIIRLGKPPIERTPTGGYNEVSNLFMRFLMLGYIVISVSAFIGYIISTIGGGGGSLLLVPVLSFVLGSRAVAPVL
jgi:hypothetical protein